MLCDGEFGRITYSHLEHVHGITFDEYLEMFPGVELTSEETRQLLAGNQYATYGTGTLGYSHTEKSKREMSVSSLGNQGCLGYRHTEKALQQMAEAARGNHYALGHKYSHPEDVRCRMSELMRERWQDPEYAHSVLRHRQPNGCEFQLQSVLDKHFLNEWKYVGDGTFWLAGKNPDFMNIDGKKQVIEVFGYHWHDSTYFPNRMSEEELIAHYKKYGFDCLVFWEYDVYSEEEVVERVHEAFGGCCNEN